MNIFAHKYIIIIIATTITRSKTSKKMTTKTEPFTNDLTSLSKASTLSINTFMSAIFTLFVTLWSTVKIYILWIFIHWATVQFYQTMCVPCSIWGLIFGSTMAVQMPHCRGALWLINISHNANTNMWLIFGTWIITQVQTRIQFWPENLKK